MTFNGLQADPTDVGVVRHLIARCLVALVVALLLPAPAHAAYECNVSVKNVLIYREGSVNVLHTGRGDYTVVCSMKGTYGGVDPTTCAMWTAMLQSIKKKNGIANFYFDGTGSCDSMGTYWSAPAPVYIGDVTPTRVGR